MQNCQLVNYQQLDHNEVRNGNRSVALRCVRQPERIIFVTAVGLLYLVLGFYLCLFSFALFPCLYLLFPTPYPLALFRTRIAMLDLSEANLGFGVSMR